MGNVCESVQRQKPRSSTELVNSIKNRFYKTSESFSPLGIPETDSMVLCAQWLSRLPCQALLPMFFPKSAKNPFGDIPAASKAFSFDLLVPSSAAKDRDSGVHSSSCYTPMADDLSDTTDDLQEISMKVNCLEGREDGIVGSPCVTEDNIIPESRPRAYALDRSNSLYHLDTAF